LLHVDNTGIVRLAVDASGSDSHFRAKLRSINKVGLASEILSNLILVDESEPVPGDAWVVGDTFVYAPHVNALCQRYNSSVRVAWTGFFDGESGISSYAVAIGNAPGAADIAPYRNVGNVLMAQVHGLHLAAGATFYATVRAESGAGLHTSTTTAGTVVFQADRASHGGSVAPCCTRVRHAGHV